MGTNKPLITIVVAVYDPRIDWLTEQLTSLNAQTYPNLELNILDDCSPTVPFEEISACVQRCITAFPYTLRRNKTNIGSNLTFERLTKEAKGKYFAYCDQDDIWLPDKLSVLQQKMQDTGALLACSDMFVIDGEGNQTAKSITKVRRHQVFRSGFGLAEGLLVSNFVTGCTMLVNADEAQAAIPFCPYMVHDHYIALCCAAQGEIISVQQPQICYRIHGGNQTGLMAGVTDRESYKRIRIDNALNKFRWLAERFPYAHSMESAICKRIKWAEARTNNWINRKGRMIILRYCKFSLLPSLFEVAAPYLPDCVFDWFIQKSKSNTF